jgi:hypothetical protein
MRFSSFIRHILFTTSSKPPEAQLEEHGTITNYLVIPKVAGSTPVRRNLFLAIADHEGPTTFFCRLGRLTGKASAFCAHT